jgi:hypothetical protein
MPSKKKKAAPKASAKFKDLKPKKSPKGGSALRISKPDMMDAQ